MNSKYKIAFNTANLVARFTGYRFELKNWGMQHQKTVAATDETAWRAICQEIAAAGYTAVEIWAAHIDPAKMTADRMATWKRVLADNGLTAVGCAGGFTVETLRVCEGMGIPAINGGLWDSPPVAEIEKLSKKTGIRYNYENHPEKSAQEVLEKINGGSDMIGVAVETGWFASQGANCPAEVQALGKLVRHLHVKDVTHVASHDTCPLGKGIADLSKVIAQLKSSGYSGWYSWEDEPENRNPMDIAVESRRWIESQLAT